MAQAAYNPVILFDSIFEVLQKAMETSNDTIKQQYVVAERSVHVQFASRCLASRMMPALEGLTAATRGEPELVIYAWDTASTHIPLPDLPWYTWMRQELRLTNARGESFDHIYTPRGDIRGHHNQRILGRCGEKTYTFFDAERNIGLFWCADAEQLPWYEIGAPFRTQFNWWLRRAGIQLIHAGAVGTADRCALLVGKGGSGKSTTALTCLDSKLYYISDDYCLLETKPIPRCRALYSTAKIFYEDLFRVPHLEAYREEMQKTSQEKALFYVQHIFPERFINTLPIHCILLPHVTGARYTTVRPAATVEALKALALSTIHQITGAGKEVLQIVKQLVQQVPSYHLDLGTRMDEIPEVIQSLLVAHQGV